MVWDWPGWSVTAQSPTLAVSTQSISVHSWSPKSGMRWLLSIQGFQTTVDCDPDLLMVIARCQLLSVT
jgi:hypothetical protein